MGVSTKHASTVSVVRNINTHRLSPQFHCVHDDHFDTIHCSDTTPPDNWDELVVMQSFRADLDDDDYIPDLDEEWLSPEALKQRRNVPVPSLDSDNPAQQRVDSAQQRVDPISNKGTHDNLDAAVPADDDATGAQEIESDNLESSASPSNLPRRSGRARREPLRFKFDAQHGYLACKSCMREMSRS